MRAARIHEAVAKRKAAEDWLARLEHDDRLSAPNAHCRARKPCLCVNGRVPARHAPRAMRQEGFRPRNSRAFLTRAL